VRVALRLDDVEARHDALQHPLKVGARRDRRPLLVDVPDRHPLPTAAQPAPALSAARAKRPGSRRKAAREGGRKGGEWPASGRDLEIEDLRGLRGDVGLELLARLLEAPRAVREARGGVARLERDVSG
jgi:hypothetical protein